MLNRLDARALPLLRTPRGAWRVFWQFPGPRMLAVQVAAAAGARLGIGEFGAGDVLVLALVAVVWPLQEWFFHWTLLHWKPRTVAGVRIDLPMAVVHRDHHRRPWHIATTFLPERFVLFAIPVHVAVWFAVTPSTALAATGIAAFGAAALFYEWVHYIVHTPCPHQGRYHALVARNHLLHHFRHEDYWHSFTVPLVDVVFGTAPDPATVPKSPTVMTLGVPEDGPG